MNDNEKKPVSRKQAEARVKYLKSELAHEGYHDGWTLKGMREEVEWLEKELKKAWLMCKIILILLLYNIRRIKYDKKHN